MSAYSNARDALAEFDEYADAGAPVDWRVGRVMGLLRALADERDGMYDRSCKDGLLIWEYTLRLEKSEAIIEGIKETLDEPSDERGITWWEWLDGGLGGTIHDDLRAILYPDESEVS